MRQRAHVRIVRRRGLAGDALCPAFPEILESSAESATAQRNNVVLSEHCPKHAATLEAIANDSLASRFDDERFATYVILGEKGSEKICLNGPTARKGVVGDRVIIFCYAYYDQKELEIFKPIVVSVSEKNQITAIKDNVAMGDLRK